MNLMNLLKTILMGYGLFYGRTAGAAVLAVSPRTDMTVAKPASLYFAASAPVCLPGTSEAIASLQTTAQDWKQPFVETVQSYHQLEPNSQRLLHAIDEWSIDYYLDENTLFKLHDLFD